MKDYSHYDFAGLVRRLSPARADLFSSAQVRLVGIRGAETPEGLANSFARYDDQVLVFVNGSFVGNWLWSVDPSWYFVQNPIVRDNTGTLRTGQLCSGVYLFGDHLLHGQYPCFGQAEDVHLNRLNRDGTVDHVEVGDFAVCLHSGGVGMDTGRFSLACQILENPDGYFGNPTWDKFYLPIRDALSRFSLETFPYFLVNVADVLPPVAPATPSTVATPPSPSPVPPPPVIPVAGAVRNLLSITLSGNSALTGVIDGAAPLQRSTPPMQVPGIAQVQDALLALNIPLDLGPSKTNRGCFDPATEAALQNFQRQTPGLTVTGTVTSETLFALDQGLLELAQASTPLPATTPRPALLTVTLPSLTCYSPPPASAAFLAKVPFASAALADGKYLKKFAAFDQLQARQDPSRCQVLLRFPDGTLYFDAKMAVDTDGSPNAARIDPNPNDASLQTSWRYPGNAVQYFDAEKIPYIVLPEHDKNSGDDFLGDMQQQLGNLAVVIYKNNISGAIFADEGPTHKIGEGSVHLHELLKQNPWNKARTKIIDSSIEDSVLYFVFAQSVGADITPDNAAELIQERARACFEKLGGVWPVPNPPGA